MRSHCADGIGDQASDILGVGRNARFIAQPKAVEVDAVDQPSCVVRRGRGGPIPKVLQVFTPCYLRSLASVDIPMDPLEQGQQRDSLRIQILDDNIYLWLLVSNCLGRRGAARGAETEAETIKFEKGNKMKHADCAQCAHARTFLCITMSREAADGRRRLVVAFCMRRITETIKRVLPS